MSEQADMIRVNMLGGYRSVIGDKVFCDNATRTGQVWNLLEYLIVFRHKTISHGELIQSLWPESDNEDPANALKNLIYRIRSVFIQAGVPFGKDMIISKRGSYCWNNDLPCVVDVEEFERLSREAAEKKRPAEERIDRYLQAIALYKSEFLPGSCYEEWVVPLSDYYRTIYFKCVHSVLELLTEAGRYAEAQAICEKALIIDQFEEQVHKYLLYALARQGSHNKAMAHYNYVLELFYNELGVNPSDSMKNLYREIVKTVNNVEIDLNMIKRELNESENITGAYYCEYEVFKDMYRVEARAAARTEQSIFVGLLTLTDSRGDAPDRQMLNKGMERLLQLTVKSLRKGDVIARYSPTQYVVMFPTRAYEHGRLVMDRLSLRFRADSGLKSLDVHTNFLPVDPVG
jgi:DNA-binding SARP family transcriptional activator